ncbi:MAG: ATP-grasp domain-containing protein [Candidatus Wallbacteria bacterium]|nr:ATP-grasp domain-containing protein [Candidatus Wallbacteria bacterium]
MPGLQVLILYNLPTAKQVKGKPQDSISEAGVLHAVEAVASALADLGAEPDTFGVGLHTRTLLARLSRRRPAIVFNLCEGLGGEASFEYLIPGLLEAEGIPYTGSGPAALITCLDKVRTKQILAHHGIPTPAFRVFAQGEAVVADGSLEFPLIVKPAHEDASLGIEPASVVTSEQALRERIAFVHGLYRQPALVERYVDGREFNVSVLGNSPPRSLPLAEIDFGGLPQEHPRICSYEAKWIEDSPIYTGTPSVCPAPGVPGELALEIAAIARRAYALLGCRDYGRVDIRVGASGTPQVLEVNPNPDLTPDAGLTKAAVADGLGYRGLVQSILESALERHRTFETRHHARGAMGRQPIAATRAEPYAP